MDKLNGKIYWFLGDLKDMTGDFKTTGQVSSISDIRMDDNFIEFQWHSNSDFWGGSVNLLAEHGSNYKGTAKIIYSVKSIDVSAELFKNGKNFFLRGSWLEDGAYYTWFAEIKNN